MNTSHDRKENQQEWLTPPFLLEALGNFDLDPCSPVTRPWATAKRHFTIEDDGFNREWNGLVWCNPPYNEVEKWLLKCAEHGNAIGLTFARTETRWFFNSVWNKADAALFLKGRLRFHHVSGERGGSAGAPSVLIAYGPKSVEILRNCKLKGKFLLL